MGILEGKRILVTGVLTEASIAFAAAKIAQRDSRLVDMYVFVAVVYFVINMIAGNLIAPKVQGDAIRVHPDAAPAGAAPTRAPPASVPSAASRVSTDLPARKGL